MATHGIHPVVTLLSAAWMANSLLAGCTTERLEERLQPTGRLLQPTVSAFECGGGSVKAAIARCRAEGGQYGHCAIVASRTGVTDATACYTYADDVRKRRSQLVGQENQLDAQLRYLRDVNGDTETLNAELTEKLGEVTVRTDTAVESLARSEMTQSDLAQLRDILDIEVSTAKRQFEAASRELQAASQYRSREQPSAGALDLEIARLQALLEETQRETNALVAQRQRI